MHTWRRQVLWSAGGMKWEILITRRRWGGRRSFALQVENFVLRLLGNVDYLRDTVLGGGGWITREMLFGFEREGRWSNEGCRQDDALTCKSCFAASAPARVLNVTNPTGWEQEKRCQTQILIGGAVSRPIRSTHRSCLSILAGHLQQRSLVALISSEQ